MPEIKPIVTEQGQSDLERLLLWAEKQGAQVEESAFGKCVVLPGHHCYLLVNPETERVEIVLRLDVPLAKLYANADGKLEILGWLRKMHPVA